MFTIGDQVRLNSGGPKMTVISIVDYTIVECQWFVDENNVGVCRFKPETLTKLDPVQEKEKDA